jgi:hypothetical protein
MLYAFLYILLIHRPSSATVGAATAGHEEGVLQLAHLILIILQTPLVPLNTTEEHQEYIRRHSPRRRRAREKLSKRDGG